MPGSPSVLEHEIMKSKKINNTIFNLENEQYINNNMSKLSEGNGSASQAQQILYIDNRLLEDIKRHW